MYVGTYKALGALNMSSSSELYEFDVWDLTVDSAGVPRAFSCYKKTPFGLKSGASGFDGSAEGKSFQISNIRTKFFIPGVYGEVSHSVESIALKAGAPVVCNSLVPKILKKQVLPHEDQIHYTRAISGVGTVQKIMVGSPIGIPTTDASSPVCGVVASAITEGENPSRLTDWCAHIACML